MGRRSINTTKSGKYMNPTDQARKEARKQELKKNKKQRQMVRAAVLKGKDPQQILEEMEKIDQMEYNVNQPSPLNEKVLKDKRKKLRDTLERVLIMYYKDDPDKWSELKKRQTEYEQKRNQLVAFFESVKSAQLVTVDEIPLPQLPQQLPIVQSNPTGQIPLPTTERKQEHTIYSIATALKLQAMGLPIREPPGCPPGPPPDVNENGEVVEFASNKTRTERTDKDLLESEELGADKDNLSSVKPTSLQQKMVALSGQNVDEFMKEMETVQKKFDSNSKDEERAKVSLQIEPLAPPGTSESLSLGVPPPSMLPPPMAFQAIRVPPGPPPGRPLMPPGPPPRLPLRLPQVAPRLVRLTAPPPVLQPNVLTAGPQLVNRESGKQGATISAKPQIRNLSADVTRFVPSALRVKREDKKQKQSQSAFVRELKQKEFTMHQNAVQGRHTKDDAYKMFMAEMEQLL